MPVFIRERGNSQSVIDVFDRLDALLGTERFNKVNGSEFSNPKRLEFDAQGNRRTWIFCCDPCASFQKPNVELNHEFIRNIPPNEILLKPALLKK